MSKKQINSRLENLFSDLADRESDGFIAPEQQGIDSPESDAQASVESDHERTKTSSVPLTELSGWTWELDANRKYVTCGDEINNCLGIPREHLTGKPMLSFAMHARSAAGLAAALSQDHFPVEQIVFMEHISGKWAPVQMHIVQRQESAGEWTGWQGFAQMLPPDSIPLEEVRPAYHEPDTTPLPKAPHPNRNGTAEAKHETSAPTLQPKAHESGVAIELGDVHPATRIWTEVGLKSLDKNEMAFANTQSPNPATIAVPFQMQGVGDLLLEVIDDKEQREWSDDDRFLVMEVVSQLALALDNAQLYISAQQELAERTRAEQTILRRNKDLATLNQIGQQLSRLATRAEIFDLLSTMIGEVLNNDHLYICSYNPLLQALSYPVYRENGEVITAPEQPAGNGIPEYVMRTKSPLLVTSDLGSVLARFGIDLPERLPVSLLAIPMVAGERAIGAMVVQDYEQENAFDSLHAELLSTAAAQATTALENADLFQQMQSALEALENRERYQSNVAKAAATLTEFGTKSMAEVLKWLGQAAQCSRIYFARIQEDERGLYWSATAEWTNSNVAYLFDKARIVHMPVGAFPTWAKDLSEQGWAIIHSSENASPEADFIGRQQIRTTLLLSVLSESAVPSFLAFDQLGSARNWQNDEVNALRVAADAIANTFVREDLMDQVQVSLEETENLYKASNRLALANDMQEMVLAVVTGMRTPDINRAVLLLFEYDNYSKVNQIYVGANWYRGRGTPPPQVGTEYLSSKYERFFQMNSPMFFKDLEAEQVDPELQEMLLQQNIRGLAILPLWTGKRQTGVLMLQSETAHHFSGRETRTYPPLADQMAIAVENQRLFEQTQKALAETELLYNISNRVAQAAEAQDMLELVVENVLPAGADRVALILLESDEQGELFEYELVGFHELRGKYQRLGMRQPITTLPLIKALTDEPLIVTDTAEYPLDPASLKTLEQLEVGAVCLVPLRTSGHLTGALLASAKKPTVFNPEDTHLLRITGNGIAVAIEKQRLLRQAQRRALELQTASEIARDTTSTLSLDLLLNRIVSLLAERFAFYHTSIFLLDETGSQAIVREATGEAGSEMKELGHKQAVGSHSVVGRVTSTGESFILNDVLRNLTFFPNPLLPETRSEMGVPLKISDKVIGALDLHSQMPNAFNADDVTVLQILADQIAIAIENARAYELSQKAIEDMKEVDRVKSQFLANISHELRTPLNSIIGFSRVILKGIDGPINDTQTQDLSAIYNSGQHLLSLINDILDLSKIEAGKMELAFSDMNLHDMVNSAMSTAVGLVKDKSIKLNTVVPENLPTVRADQTRVRQVLINFLSNAAKFTDDGSITVETALITSPANKPEIIITVTDTGPGIAQQDQNKLFLPFSQVDDSPTRKTGGTGLGLSICRSLIEMHGGRIGLLKSEVGKGSTFFFTLPANIPLPSPMLTTADPEANVVMAIDDDERVIHLYERYLKPHGYQVVPVTHPKDAVARAKEVHPFAITLDIMMPEKDGWQVMRDLKQDAATRDIPIVVCSIMENQEKGFSMGAADYLVKPFLQEDLSSAINRLNVDGLIREVLVIDDDPEDLRLVQKMLEDQQKYRVSAAQGGKQGWETIQSNRPDAVIMDLFMPDMNGFTILESLRANSTLRNTPVIILTGADLTPEQHQQLSDFGQGLLTKGYLREKELLVILEEALRKFHPVSKDD